MEREDKTKAVNCMSVGVIGVGFSFSFSVAVV
jgi:hypothetical protein